MKYIVLILSCIAMHQTSFSQGCSDAGFCSLSVLKNNIADSSKQTISAGFNYGNGQKNTNIYTAYIEYKYNFNKHFSVQAKVTGSHASGFLGSNTNAGDIFAIATYTQRPQADTRLTVLAGFKIPLTVANDKNNNGKPLPLDYQSSIGTYDAIAGINYIIQNKWELNAGLQIPVIQVNKNSFFPGEYADGRANDFAATNLFKRATDVLVRAGYYIRFKKKHIVVKPNVLAIYHTANDSYVNTFGKRTAINGSKGATVNAGITATKTFRNNHQLELIAATPFIVRDVRPDGLTRAAVFNVQYSIKF